MTQAELEAIRTRLRKASAGPWTVMRMPNLWRGNAGDRRTHPAVRAFRVPKRMYEIAPEQVEGDAAFMAHARQDIPALLAEFDRLRAIVRDLRIALRDVATLETHDSTPDLERIAFRLRHDVS